MEALLLTGLHWLVIFCGVIASLALLLWWRAVRSPLARKTRERIAASVLDFEIDRPAFVGGQAVERESPRRETRVRSAITRYLAEAGVALDSRLVFGLAGAWVMLTTLVVINVFDTLILSVLGIMLGCAIPVLYVMRRRSRAEQRLERQLPEALDVMARALQAGKPLSTCWLEMSQVLEAPIAPLCHDIHLKLQYGGELDDVLGEMSMRVPSEDVRFFFTALRIQTRSGGNLIALLRDQSELIRERLALRGRIRAISSESRLSAWIMGLMPFFVTLMMYFLSPKTMSLLWTTPAGVSMIEFGLVLQLLGVVWIARLVRIRV